MTYNVFSGMLNPTQSINQSISVRLTSDVWQHNTKINHHHHHRHYYYYSEVFQSYCYQIIYSTDSCL